MSFVCTALDLPQCPGAPIVGLPIPCPFECTSNANCSQGETCCRQGCSSTCEDECKWWSWGYQQRCTFQDEIIFIACTVVDEPNIVYSCAYTRIWNLQWPGVCHVLFTFLACGWDSRTFGYSTNICIYYWSGLPSLHGNTTMNSLQCSLCSLFLNWMWMDNEGILFDRGNSLLQYDHGQVLQTLSFVLNFAMK